MRDKHSKASSDFDHLLSPAASSPLAPLDPLDGPRKSTSRRGAASKTTVDFDALSLTLPQGQIEPESPLPPEDELQFKGKRTRTKARLIEPPQGLLPLDPLPLEESSLEYSTVIRQVRKNMQKFENCVLLTRVGGFYELYFEQAENYWRLLNIKLGSKPNKSGPRIPFTGFPFFQLDRYLKVLVQDNNCFVAIAEEFPNDPSGRVKSGGLMHDRRVTRIITPGTLIDENFMDPHTNNYVLAIHVVDPSYSITDTPSVASSVLGLAWLDLSTGHFFTETTTLTELPSFLARIGPREVVLREGLQTNKEHGIFSVLQEEHYLISYVNCSEIKPISQWSSRLESPVSARSLAEFTTQEVAAGSALLEYVEARLQGSDLKLQPPTRQSHVMGIDKNTMRALEIKKTIRDDNFAGSLLHTIRRTNTKGGARLLDSWLSSPSTSLEVIDSRLDLVTHILKHKILREKVIVLLKGSHDSHRLLQKFAFGRGEASDLLDIATTVSVTRELVTALTESDEDDSYLDDSHIEDCVRNLVDRIQLDGPSALAARIKEAIDEEGLMAQHQIQAEEADEVKALAKAIVNSEPPAETPTLQSKPHRKSPSGLKDYYGENEVWIMKPSASPILERLHEELLYLSSEKEALQEDLKLRLSVSTLTLKFTPGLGHICHVTGKDRKRDLTDTDLKSVGSSKTTRSFHHPEWTDLGQRIDQCRIQIRAEEQRVFSSLREHVLHNIIKLRRNAAVLDELDVACSFATLAAEKHWTRPILNQSFAHKIVGGAHPTVEGGLREEGRTFVTNDCFVGDIQRSWLITGPNMAGKSTFLRQNALITILAQVSSYVPAQYAEIGLVDQIFSRVGSADNLYRDQSTFMVEMLETAMILKNATPRSFVIMDEIGRGTTPTDGIAVAFGCLHHLYHINRSRTLFATHFHDLADMAVDEGMKGVGFYCTDVEEESGGGEGFRYIHKLRQGVNRESHALKVARLAGLPEEAIGVAKRVLESNSNEGVAEELSAAP